MNYNLEEKYAMNIQSSDLKSRGTGLSDDAEVMSVYLKQ